MVSFLNNIVFVRMRTYVNLLQYHSANDKRIALWYEYTST